MFHPLTRRLTSALAPSPLFIRKGQSHRSGTERSRSLTRAGHGFLQASELWKRCSSPQPSPVAYEAPTSFAYEVAVGGINDDVLVQASKKWHALNSCVGVSEVSGLVASSVAAGGGGVAAAVALFPSIHI